MPPVAEVGSSGFPATIAERYSPTTSRRHHAAAGQVRCLGCGALVPDLVGPVHGYMLAAPGCWKIFGSIMARPDFFKDATSAQWCVDSYAAQHATNDERRNRQSVAVHLMSLSASLEDGVAGARLRTLIGQWAAGMRDAPPVLQPRPGAFTCTVGDLEAASPASRRNMAKVWASSTWDAWAGHHEQVRQWLSRQQAR